MPDPNTRFYAHKAEGYHGPYYCDIYAHPFSTRACDGKVRKPIVEIELVPDPEGAYWAWHDFEDNEYCFIWPSQAQLQICFAYGVEAAQERGLGAIVRFSVREVDTEGAIAEEDDGGE